MQFWGPNLNGNDQVKRGQSKSFYLKTDFSFLLPFEIIKQRKILRTIQMYFAYKVMFWGDVRKDSTGSQRESHVNTLIRT